jgi:hypothetical protein
MLNPTLATPLHRPNPPLTDSDTNLTSILYFNLVGTGTSAMRDTIAPNRRRFRCLSVWKNQQ